jgi:hypothetical protein
MPSLEQALSFLRGKGYTVSEGNGVWLLREAQDPETVVAVFKELELRAFAKMDGWKAEEPHV